ncbi:MAG: lipoyl(octanoyl) transferase LipB [candidate division Zixibacteria bacterium]|nr:lipoyl(octanoyl) transferase LipB [candidate division Zixibacteria bacterium]
MSTAKPTPLTIVDWGLLPYREAHLRQLEALESRLAGSIADTVFLVEHPHVYTYGRAAKPSSSMPSQLRGVECVAVERGGDVTYHGPGQLVAYPVVDVRALTGDLHRFLYWLEEVIITTIEHWGIYGVHHPTYTGVWVGERKIASIGVAVRKWISYHGIALNVSTDLSYFSGVDPCGLPAEVMTSMEMITGKAIAVDAVKEIYVDALRRVSPCKSE